MTKKKVINKTKKKAKAKPNNTIDYLKGFIDGTSFGTNIAFTRMTAGIAMGFMMGGEEKKMKHAREARDDARNKAEKAKQKAIKTAN